MFKMNDNRVGWGILTIIVLLFVVSALLSARFRFTTVFGCHFVTMIVLLIGLLAGLAIIGLCMGISVLYDTLFRNIDGPAEAAEIKRENEEREMERKFDRFLYHL